MKTLTVNLQLTIIAPKDSVSDFTQQLDSWVSFQFNGTLDMCFNAQFLSLFSTQNGPSIRSISGTPHISFAISQNGSLSLALSRDLDQCTGLDASKQLYDSAVFDASTRLLGINLTELPKLKGKLERIQRNVQRLSEPKWLLNCVAVCSKEGADAVRQSLTAAGCKLTTPIRPFVPSTSALPGAFAIPSDIDWSNKDELWEYLEWCSWALCLRGATPADPPKSARWTPSCASMQTAPDMVALEVHSALLPPISLGANFFLASGRVARASPPSLALNAQREAHFRPKNFDPTVSTADDQAFLLTRHSPQGKASTIVSFKLNRTA
jgi:hypothetical protein